MNKTNRLLMLLGLFLISLPLSGFRCLDGDIGRREPRPIVEGGDTVWKAPTPIPPEEGATVGEAEGGMTAADAMGQLQGLVQSGMSYEAILAMIPAEYQGMAIAMLANLGVRPSIVSAPVVPTTDPISTGAPRPATE